MDTTHSKGKLWLKKQLKLPMLDGMCLPITTNKT